MKKLAVTLLSVALLAGCANPSSKNTTTNSSSSTVKLSKEDQKALDQATSEYKEFVQGQIDQLLKDTEEFQRVLKSGDLEEAKKVYPLIRMSYERSEPIAESFGESDVKIDFRLVDYVDENKSEEGWSGFHRIERTLWEENTTEGTEKYAEQLVNDIKAVSYTHLSGTCLLAGLLKTGISLISTNSISALSAKCFCIY